MSAPITGNPIDYFSTQTVNGLIDPTDVPDATGMANITPQGHTFQSWVLADGSAPDYAAVQTAAVVLYPVFVLTPPPAGTTDFIYGNNVTLNRTYTGTDTPDTVMADMNAIAIANIKNTYVSFEGWFAADGTQVTSFTSANVPATLIARYSKRVQVVLNSPDGNYGNPMWLSVTAESTGNIVSITGVGSPTNPNQTVAEAYAALLDHAKSRFSNGSALSSFTITEGEFAVALNAAANIAELHLTAQYAHQGNFVTVNFEYKKNDNDKTETYTFIVVKDANGAITGLFDTSSGNMRDISWLENKMESLGSNKAPTGTEYVGITIGNDSATGAGESRTLLTNALSAASNGVALSVNARYAEVGTLLRQVQLSFVELRKNNAALTIEYTTHDFNVTQTADGSIQVAKSNNNTPEYIISTLVATATANVPQGYTLTGVQVDGTFVDIADVSRMAQLFTTAATNASNYDQIRIQAVYTKEVKVVFHYLGGKDDGGVNTQRSKTKTYNFVITSVAASTSTVLTLDGQTVEQAIAEVSAKAVNKAPNKWAYEGWYLTGGGAPSLDASVNMSSTTILTNAIRNMGLSSNPSDINIHAVYNKTSKVTVEFYDDDSSTASLLHTRTTYENKVTWSDIKNKNSLDAVHQDADFLGWAVRGTTDIVLVKGTKLDVSALWSTQGASMTVQLYPVYATPAPTPTPTPTPTTGDETAATPAAATAAAAPAAAPAAGDDEPEEFETLTPASQPTTQPDGEQVDLGETPLAEPAAQQGATWPIVAIILGILAVIAATVAIVKHYKKQKSEA